MNSVVTRIPPSPTGRLHLGTARTALFNYAFARHHGGKIIFRSEDTDRERSTSEFEQEIIDGLHWLGLSWDSFVRQSERSNRYTELLEQVIKEGKAYLSREPAKNDPGREVEIVRLKNPGVDIIFDDIVRGPIHTHTGELGDFVIARSRTDALYHFAVVVDDMDGGVTHVIRGEDHISNTARQILIQEALGIPRPIYVHLPLILAPDRSKMSKRHGAISIYEYQEEGFLPEAINNYLALLGWSPGNDREDFSLSELVEAFDFKGIQKGGAIFNREKFLSVNQRWMRKLTDEEYITKGNLATPDLDPGILLKTVPLLKERVHTFSEAAHMLKDELSGLFSLPALDRKILLAMEPEGAPEATKRHLESLIAPIQALETSVSPNVAKAALMPYADQNPKEAGGRGAVLWPLRYALSGKERSPDPFTLISILDKEEVLSRIQSALAIIKE